MPYLPRLPVSRKRGIYFLVLSKRHNQDKYLIAGVPLYESCQHLRFSKVLQSILVLCTNYIQFVID